MSYQLTFNDSKDVFEPTYYNTCPVFRDVQERELKNSV
jgi:hypothetical protein